MPQQKTIESVKPKWKPVDPPEKQKAVLKAYQVHIVGKKGSEQIIENMRGEPSAIAQYVKDNKLISWHHTFRAVEMQPA